MDSLYMYVYMWGTWRSSIWYPRVSINCSTAMSKDALISDLNLEVLLMELFSELPSAQ